MKNEEKQNKKKVKLDCKRAKLLFDTLLLMRANPRNPARIRSSLQSPVGEIAPVFGG